MSWPETHRSPPPLSFQCASVLTSTPTLIDSCCRCLIMAWVFFPGTIKLNRSPSLTQNLTWGREVGSTNMEANRRFFHSFSSFSAKPQLQLLLKQIKSLKESIFCRFLLLHYKFWFHQMINIIVRHIKELIRTETNLMPCSLILCGWFSTKCITFLYSMHILVSLNCQNCFKVFQKIRYLFMYKLQICH